MSEIFYFRRMDPPAAPRDLRGMMDFAGGCFNLHRVEWIRSFLANDGSVMLCWYRAPDLESGRIALRTLGSDMSGVFDSHELYLKTTSEPDLESVDTMIEVCSGEAWEEEDVHRIAADIESQRDESTLVQSIYSLNESRAIFLLSIGEDTRSPPVVSGSSSCTVNVWPCLSLEPPTNNTETKTPFGTP